MNKLRHFRELKGLTQVDLARCSGVEQANISRVENGKGGFPVGVWVKLAEILECDLQELLGVKK